MKFLPLVWAQLWRSKARTWLTFLSIVVAFLLFGVLRSIAGAFDLGVRLSGDDRLMVTYKQGPTKLLPVAYRSRIEAADPENILVVSPTMFLPGSYQDPKNQLQIIAVDPVTLRATDPRLVISDEHAAAFERTRTGVLVGAATMERYGWKLGDRIPVQSPAQRKDGAQSWEFDLVGTFDLDPVKTGAAVPALGLLMPFEAYNEATAYPNVVVFYVVRVKDPKRAAATAKAIDAVFRNSEMETRTQSEADFQRGFARQFGAVGKMMSAILAAVFFTLLLVAGNTMMQAFRERVPELAVLKTLGFGDGRIAALVTAESLILCGAAGAAGLGLAVLALGFASTLPLGGLEAGLIAEPAMLALGLLVALAVGAAAALIPAWRAARLSVVQGLVQS